MIEKNIYQGQSIEIMGCPFLLLPSKAIYWPEKKMLILADLHLGKISHFRKEGIGIPLEAKNQNWRELNELIEQFKPKQVFFLGDLFHSKYNNEWIELEQFMANYEEVEFHLVLGNHDILDSSVYEKSRIHTTERYEIDSFSFTHHPLDNPKPDQFNFCGHIHPSVRLSGKGRQSIKLSCFYIMESQMILPAFGVFTGTKNLEIEKAISIYGIVEGQMLKIK